MTTAYPKSARLTDEFIHRLPFTPKGQAKIRDEECRGLLVVIGMETKTFSAKVERLVSGVRESAYQSFGSFDPTAPDNVGVKVARKAAAKWIADYKNGASVMRVAVGRRHRNRKCQLAFQGSRRLCDGKPWRRIVRRGRSAHRR